MMLNAQKMIEERKKALSIPSTKVQKNNGKDKKPQITTDFEKQAKIAQLQVINYLNILYILDYSDYINIINYIIVMAFIGSNTKKISYWNYKDSSKCT